MALTTTATEPAYFAFEAEFVATLRCIPMVVRYKLDQCGIKLSLRAWSRLPLEVRSALAGRLTRSAEEIASYRAFLCQALLDLGEPPVTLPPAPVSASQSEAGIPDSVTAKANASGVPPLDRARWRDLTPLQRFALVKLTRDGHENANFVPALREFGLTTLPTDGGGP